MTPAAPGPLIDVDDMNTQMWGPRGDAVLYRNNTDSGTRDDLWDLVWRPFDYDEHDYMYWDADNDGIYSPRDAVVDDVDGSNTYTAGDVVAIGGATPITLGVALADFDTDEFWAEDPNDGNADALDPSDYIFRENELTGDDNTLAALVRHVGSDRPAGCAQLHRACPGDRREQQPRYARPGLLRPGSLQPARARGDHARHDASDDRSRLRDRLLSGRHAGNDRQRGDRPLPEPALRSRKDEVRRDRGRDGRPEHPQDALRVLAEQRHDLGHRSTSTTIRTTTSASTAHAGYQKDAGFVQAMDDELFFDADGDLLYDADDYVLYAGRNGVVDTPVGAILLPLSGEEGAVADGLDDDGDGSIDEDLTGGARAPRTTRRRSRSAGT